MTNYCKHLGDFLGANLPEDQLDGILAYNISKSDLATARSLFSSKWWDYRFVHPGHCYFLFAHLYGEAVEQWRDKFGINPYAKLKAVGHPCWRTETERGAKIGETKRHRVLRPQVFRTGLWRAMCFADAHGVPYDRFIKLAFEHAFDNRWQRLPQPQSLYGTWMVSAVVERWTEEQRTLTRLPCDDRYMAASYQGHPHQEQFQESLLTNIQARANPSRALGNYLLNEPYLVLQKAVSRFGKDTVRSALMRVSR